MLASPSAVALSQFRKQRSPVWDYIDTHSTTSAACDLHSVILDFSQQAPKLERVHAIRRHRPFKEFMIADQVDH